MLRITSGKLRNRKLYTLKTSQTRPTTEKTRQIIFNCLHHHLFLNEFYVYDIFAGTGALGMEALSQGALHAFFIEKDKQAFLNLKKNISSLSIEGESSLYYDNVIHWIKQHEFKAIPSLFFLDPPYKNNLTNIIIKEILNLDLKTNRVILVLERSNNFPVLFPKQLELFQHKKTGITCLDFLQRV